MLRVAVGFSVGYLLGSRAGRERYDQIIRWSSKAGDSPAVQGAAGFIRAKVSSLLPAARQNRDRPDPAYLDAEPGVASQAPWTGSASGARV